MRVDCHNHVIPEAAIDLLRRNRTFGVDFAGYRWRGGNHVDFEVTASFREPEAKLEELDRNGLEGAIVSPAPPLFYYKLELSASHAICEATNAGMAEFCRADPERLHWMAHVPLRHGEQAVEVLEEASRESGCVGVEVGTSAGGVRLDAPELETFWACTERLGLPIMIHPDFTYDKHPSLAPWYLNNVIGLPLETTLTVERLICAGVLDRHPQARVMLVHAGGFFPYQAGRLRHARTVRPDLAQSPEDPWEFLSQLWFDCITHDRQALHYLVERVGPAHVVMGTDLPFDMALPDPTKALAAAVDPSIVDQIARTNPAQLFRIGVEPGREQAAA